MNATITVRTPVVPTPRVAQVRGLFDLPEEKTSEQTWEVHLPLEDRPWSLGLVTGPSGCGKSTIARHFWPGPMGRSFDWPADRAVVLAGVTTSSIPEFVTGTILVVVVGVQLGWLPVLATPPRDADFLTTIRYLLMPAMAMAVVYFGYIARMSRAGTIETLNSDYTRTAEMKGLSTSQVMRRHVLRNALVPTVAVIAVQIGYLFGGIIGVEKIFNYNGMGQLMLLAAQRKDIPMLTAGVIVIGIVYMLATLTADLIIAWMNPRARLETAR